MALSEEQLNTLQIVERFASSLSILGIVTIIATFCLSRDFRNPMHRLIFINAFYNSFDVTATMISVGGPMAGNGSALCQFQGFLMQMFPVADVLWTLVMAYDVFLIVFRRRDVEGLRKLELKYIGIITIVVFIPAFVFLFIRSPENGPMYGAVTLWCAISPNWVLYRIIFYYVPIWSMVFIIIILYSLVGIEIIKRRNAFNSLDSDSIPLDTIVSDNDVSLDTPKETEETIVEAERRPRSGDTAELHDGKESIASTSGLRSYENSNADRIPPSRSSLSFRQYVLMPLMFFVALLSIWVAPSINRVASFIYPGFESYPLLLAVGSTGSLRGFWNGVVFITIGMKAKKR